VKEGLEFFVPSRAEVEAVEVGSLAIDCFGNWKPVVEILHRGPDIVGKLFVHYTVPFGDNGSTITHSIKEGELVRTVPLSCKYTANELRDIEEALKINSPAARHIEKSFQS